MHRQLTDAGGSRTSPAPRNDRGRDKPSSDRSFALPLVQVNVPKGHLQHHAPCLECREPRMRIGKPPD